MMFTVENPSLSFDIKFLFHSYRPVIHSASLTALTTDGAQFKFWTVSS